MYDAVSDPYCYPGTTVLKNKLGIREQVALDAFEAEITALRAEEVFPIGRFSVTHYRAVHRHLFQDVYPWAGRFRTIRIAKGGNMFCYPENIAAEMRTLFDWLKTSNLLRGLSSAEFAQQASHFLATLNAIHPFRDGNGRVQLTFLTMLSERASHPLTLDRLEPKKVLRVMARSFAGDERPLIHLLKELVR